MALRGAEEPLVCLAYRVEVISSCEGRSGRENSPALSLFRRCQWSFESAALHTRLHKMEKGLGSMTSERDNCSLRTSRR